MTPAPWFATNIARGLQRLAPLALPATPAAESLRLTADAWIEILWARRTWDESQDPERLTKAFAALAAGARRWPAPAELIDYLPGQTTTPTWAAAPPSPAGHNQLAVIKALLRGAIKRLPEANERRREGPCLPLQRP